MRRAGLLISFSLRRAWIHTSPPIKAPQFQFTVDVNKAAGQERRPTATVDFTNRSIEEYVAEVEIVSRTHKRMKSWPRETRDAIVQEALEHDMAVKWNTRRLRFEKQKRIGRILAVTKHYGFCFFVSYVVCYIAGFTLIYCAIRWKWIPIFHIFEMMMMAFNDLFDVTPFIDQLAQWDTFTNLGAAFIFNEWLEPLRLPFATIAFLILAPKMRSRFGRPSVFKSFAPERFH